MIASGCRQSEDSAGDAHKRVYRDQSGGISSELPVTRAQSREAPPTDPSCHMNGRATASISRRITWSSSTLARPRISIEDSAQFDDHIEIDPTKSRTAVD